MTVAFGGGYRLSMAKPDYDKIRSTLDSLLDKTMETLDRGKEEVLREVKVGNVKLGGYQLQRELGRLYQRLGQEVYGLLEGGELEIPSAQRLRDKIEAVHQALKEKEEEVSRLRTEPRTASQEEDPLDFDESESDPDA